MTLLRVFEVPERSIHVANAAAAFSAGLPALIRGVVFGGHVSVHPGMVRADGTESSRIFRASRDSGTNDGAAAKQARNQP